MPKITAVPPSLRLSAVTTSTPGATCGPSTTPKPFEAAPLDLGEGDFDVEGPDLASRYAINDAKGRFAFEIGVEAVGVRG